MSQTSMIEVLQASEPLPELAGKLQLFGQFVRSRDAQLIIYSPDGRVQIVEAE